MPLFLMTGRYVGELTDDLLQQHIAWLVPKFEAGVFLVSGGLDAVADHPASAMAIMQAETREAALAILDDEPFFRAGAIDHDVVPFSARVRGTGLDEAFTTPDLIRAVPRS